MNNKIIHRHCNVCGRDLVEDFELAMEMCIECDDKDIAATPLESYTPEPDAPVYTQRQCDAWADGQAANNPLLREPRGI